MRRTTKTTLKITAQHAAHAIHTLIAEGKLTVNDVANALKRREQLIRELRQRLDALERGVASAVEKTGRTVSRAGKRRMSAARRAALRLHGQYLGTVRPLSRAAKAKVKAIREKKGVRAAITAARKLAK